MYTTPTTMAISRLGRSLALAGEVVRSDRDVAARYFWRGPRGLRPLGWSGMEAEGRLREIAVADIG